MLVYSNKKRQKAKSSVPSDYCRICGCSFAIRLGNFGKTSYISTENLFVRPKREGVLRRKLADRFKRMSRSPRTSSAKQKLCLQIDSPKNSEQRKQNPSKRPQARRFISFDCSTATTRTTTFPSSCICFVITSGTSR